MSEDRNLIVIRGNSSAGKTTLAREVQERMGAGTANIGQDHFRRVVLREPDVAGADNIGLIAATVRHCLALRRHVVLEGILDAGRYGEMIRALVADHSGPSHVFYLDISLEDSLRRFAGRTFHTPVDEDSARRWFVANDLLGVPGEVVLPGSAPVETKVAAIMRHVQEAEPST